MSESQALTCPKCHKVSNKIPTVAINTQLHPELKEQLLDGTLLSFECQHCGEKRRITTELMYHDPEKQLLFYVSPQYKHKPEVIQAQLTEFLNNFPFPIEDYEMRIMLDPSDLIEKVQIFDFGFKDTKVELLKGLTDGLLLQQHPDKKIINRYFYLNQQQPKFLYVLDQEQLLVDCNDALQTFIEDKFKKILLQPTKGEFKIIDYHWATDAIKRNKQK